MKTIYLTSLSKLLCFKTPAVLAFLMYPLKDTLMCLLLFWGFFFLLVLFLFLLLGLHSNKLLAIPKQFLNLPSTYSSSHLQLCIFARTKQVCSLLIFIATFIIIFIYEAKVIKYICILRMKHESSYKVKNSHIEKV